MKPLRYNPGLKCDPELEALRPERLSKHTPLPSGDWKKYLIKTEPSYDGSFADADIQKFRPNPTPSLSEDPWYTSRLPGHTAVSAVGAEMSGVPGDTLSQIKMRNRRFQQSCAMEGMGGGQPAMMRQGPSPAMMMCPAPGMMMMMPGQPQLNEDLMMMGGMNDELAMIEQDLNMTRRATR